MSNLIPSNIQLPAHLATRIGKPSVLAQAVMGGLSSGGGFPTISIKASRFRIVENGSETVLPDTELDVIIVGANPAITKTWYAKKWSPDQENNAPNCFSMDGIRPDPQSAQPQNDLCATCEHNVWGSAVNPQTGVQSKACPDTKRLAVVAADDPTGSIYLLRVTPAALKGLNQYQRELAARGIPPEVVITKVSFDTDASFPKLQFGFGGFLSEEQQEAADKLFGTDQVLEITGEKASANLIPVVQETPKLAAPAPAPKAAPKPEPVVVEEEGPQWEDTPAPAPVAAKGFGKKAATVAKTKPAAPAAEPAPVVSGGLADEIAALVGGMSDDDA